MDGRRTEYRKLKKFISKVMSKLSPGQPGDAKICAAYIQLLGRQPSSDELLHWKTLGTGLGVIKNTLQQSYEHGQRKAAQKRVLVELPDFKIYANSDDSDVGQIIVRSNGYEPHVEAVVREILRAGDVFLDLGANIGYFSLFFCEFK